jgi:DNA-binding protein H-NS
MKGSHLSKMSLDELWLLHEQVTALLSSKILNEKALLEKRLSELRLPTAATSDAPVRRSYPPVLPKFRNPVRPSETWAGRGKQPRWLTAALRKGKHLEDFRIRA